MKPLLLILCLLMAQRIAVTPGIAEVRALFDRSVSDEKICLQLIAKLEAFNENNHPLYAGYRAAATMIMAKHVFNPFSKFSYFKKGRNLLEKAIAKNKGDIELRFLRFSIQTHLPRFLDYNDNINMDKALIMQHFAALTDLALRQKIVNFLKTSDEVTALEKKWIAAIEAK
jgi:hypothetical protein